MTEIFKATGDFFTNVLFTPFKGLRFGADWWGSNMVNFIFVVVLLIYLGYWMKESKKFKDENTEDLPK